MAVAHRLRSTLAIVLVATSGSAGAQASLDPHQQLARDIYEELIEINTTTDADPGGTTKAAVSASSPSPIDKGRTSGRVPIVPDS